MGACILSDPRDDLIRRGDVLALCSKRMREYQDRMATAEREEDAGAYNAAHFRADELNLVAKLLNALPADPVAAAALALAEAKSRPNACFGTLHDGSARYEGFECSTCGHKWYPGGPVLWPREEWHHEACPAGKYRSAIAGRERGR